MATNLEGHYYSTEEEILAKHVSYYEALLKSRDDISADSAIVAGALLSLVDALSSVHTALQEISDNIPR